MSDGHERVAETACERVGQLRGVTWRWRPDAPDALAGQDMGVIAQEVEAVLPALARRGADGYLVIDYGGLVVELLAAIVELDVRTRRLEGGAASRGRDAETACGLVTRIAPGAPTTGGPRRLDPARVAEVFPAVVQPDKHGDPRIAHHTLVAPLIEAVKELDARLTASEAPRGAGPERA